MIIHSVHDNMLTYHQLASPQAHSPSLYMPILVKSWIIQVYSFSHSCHTHTHRLLQNGFRPASDNLHLGCSSHLHSFLSTWGVVMLELIKNKKKWGRCGQAWETMNLLTTALCTHKITLWICALVSRSNIAIKFAQSSRRYLGCLKARKGRGRLRHNLDDELLDEATP